MEAQQEIKLDEFEEVFEKLRHDLTQGIFSTKQPRFLLSKCSWEPPADLFETNEHIVIKMEIAGVNRDQIDIILKDSKLVVRGMRAEGDTSGKEHYHLMELHYGTFERVFPMPRRIVPGEIKASYDLGFLTITIPKRTTSDAVHIEIE